jgi:hypothetical protein
MKEKILNRLFTVKSIVTIILTLVFAYLAIVGQISTDKFQDIFYIVIAFYFGSSLEKKAKANDTTTE